MTLDLAAIEERAKNGRTRQHEEYRRRSLETLHERFWSRVQYPNGDAGCWVWCGYKARGYGRIRAGGKGYAVHRLSYEWEVGPIPDGMTLDHLCRNTACVNPAHLEVVDGTTNILRGDAPPAQNARKTHCVNGHPFDEKNTYVNPRGNRLCRTCARNQDRAYRERRRECPNCTALVEEVRRLREAINRHARSCPIPGLSREPAEETK